MESDSAVSPLHQGTRGHEMFTSKEPSLYRNEVVLGKVSKKWKMIES